MKILGKLKTTLKIPKKASKKAKKQKKERKIVKEFYEVVYIDAKGRQRKIRAKTYAEARKKAEQLIDKGHQVVEIRTAKAEVKVTVPTKKILAENIISGLERMSEAYTPQPGARSKSTRRKRGKKRSSRDQYQYNPWGWGW